MNIIAFDLETAPDLKLARQISGLSTNEEAKKWVEENRNSAREGQPLFPRLHLHKIISVSVALLDINGGEFELGCLGEKLPSDEKELLETFHSIVDDNGDATLVTWNGSNFDVPVVLQRSFIQGVSMKGLCDQGQHDNGKKYNNFLNRYHSAHMDLCDKLANFGSGRPRLGDMAEACGLGGKLGVGGPNVYEAFDQGKFQEIDDYCEVDSLLTMLLYLRYMRLTAQMSQNKFLNAMDVITHSLSDSQNPLIVDFIADVNLGEWM